MKKLIAIALMVSSTLVMAQDFEGYIKWKMSFSMPGMEDAGGENNPYAALFPKSMIVKLKNGNSLVSIEGGMMAGKTLSLKGATETILINDDRKTFSKIKSDAKDDNTKFEVQKTTETANILGYNCVKYIVTGIEPRSQQKTTTILWTTTEIKGINLENLYKIGTGGGQNMFIKGVEGIPLKVDASVDQGSMKMEAIEYKATPIADTEFKVPAGYKESASPY